MKRAMGWNVAVIAGLGLGACDDLPLDDGGVPFDSDALDTGLFETDSGLTDTDTGDSDEPPTFALAWDLSGWSSWGDAFTIDENAGGGSGQITFELSTVGVGGPTQMYLGSTRFTQDWDEEHTLAQESAAPDGSSSRYARTLSCGASSSAQLADATTLFKCGTVSNGFSDGAENQQVTVAVAVWDEQASGATGAPVDCIVFGHDPSVLLGDPGDVPEDLNVPSWVTADDCRSVNDQGQ